MNRCWQVARTYLGRWRFWIFGGFYAWIALWSYPRYWAPLRDMDASPVVGLLLSMLFANVVSCLAALHLRRLLSGPPAHAVPSFWGPHLFVGAIVSLAIWVAVPWGQAGLSGMSPLRIVALHSLAGTVSALVLPWPRFMLLLGLIPVSSVWVATERPGSALLVRAFNGEEPVLSIAAIGLAVVAYPSAALVLWLSRDRAATFSDDLVIDRSHEIASRWKQPLLQLRDGAIEWQLGRGGRFAWQWRRWRIPCAASWIEVGLLLALVIAVMTAMGFATRDPGASLFVGSVAGIVMLFIPLSSWRFRCTALSTECMRPLTRPQFVRQFINAMLCDFVIWTFLALLVTALGYLPPIWAGERDALWVLGQHAAILGSVAVLLYGTVLATIRLRYWMPWFLGLLFGSLVAGGYLAFCLVYWWFQFMQFGGPPILRVAIVLAIFTGIGLLLGATTYRRWRRMDIA